MQFNFIEIGIDDAAAAERGLADGERDEVGGVAELKPVRKRSRSLVMGWKGLGSGMVLMGLGLSKRPWGISTRGPLACIYRLHR
jgi:hypothetical protein